MTPSEIQQEVRVHWSQEDLLLLSLIVKMMELDPTFKRLEEFFEQGADLMRRLRARPKPGEDLATNGTKRHEEEGDL
jgi:hypothetical protein